MFQKISFLVFSLFLSVSVFGQGQEQYAQNVKEGSALYKLEDYAASAEKYKAAFDAIGGKAYPNDRYNAACSYALANNVEDAFYHLNYLADNPKIKYKNLSHISMDSDLDILHSDDRWEKLISVVKANKDEYEKDLDLPLVKMLDSIYQSDQSYRRQINDIEKEFGRDSEEMQAHWNLINVTDSINLIKITEILDNRGWLGADIIGGQGNGTLFLVIQHSDIETQLKYLPMMREAVEQGNARASSLALLEDRVALGQGNRQIYGSQISRDKDSAEFFVSPLIEPEKVNERRAKVGLSNIEDYVSRWDITWDVEKHKARTAKIEAEKEE